jgi:hypothetical protein
MCNKGRNPQMGRGCFKVPPIEKKVNIHRVDVVRSVDIHKYNNVVVLYMR